jgi:hypothetical protein
MVAPSIAATASLSPNQLNTTAVAVTAAITAASAATRHNACAHIEAHLNSFPLLAAVHDDNHRVQKTLDRCHGGH